MDRVPNLEHRHLCRGCETDRNARQLLASAYRRLAQQSVPWPPPVDSERKLEDRPAVVQEVVT